MGKLGDALDLISIAMGGASSSRRLMIFSSGDEKFTIPVTPAGYDVSSAQNNNIQSINKINFELVKEKMTCSIDLTTIYGEVNVIV